ncbi:lantibiotic dehydratase C-terminal domain-containing protein [Massilia scottii]|uniref:lantibiotic dehydratase C-terminal domain-containing protein n=1 Tax=Massilia scottii TaxID=3057166 RepID=UPI0035B55856
MPEWNRYGGVAAMPLVHAIFTASSHIVAEMLSASVNILRAAIFTLDSSPVSVDRLLDNEGRSGACHSSINYENTASSASVNPARRRASMLKGPLSTGAS